MVTRRVAIKPRLAAAFVFDRLFDFSLSVLRCFDEGFSHRNHRKRHTKNMNKAESEEVLGASASALPMVKGTVSDFAKATRHQPNSVRREVADHLDDFELIGRKLSNITLATSAQSSHVPFDNENIYANPQSLHLALASNVPEYQYNAVKKLRSSLCDEKVYEKTEWLLSNDFLKYFAACLRRSDAPELQYETAWCITNIAAGKPTHTKAIYLANLIDPLCFCLSSDDGQVRTQVIEFEFVSFDNRYTYYAFFRRLGH